MARVKVPDQVQPGFPKAAKPKPSKATDGVISGYLGAKYDGPLGSSEGDAASVVGLVELDGVRTVSVQLHTEMAPARDQVQVIENPPIERTPRTFLYDDTPSTETAVDFPLVRALKDFAAFTPAGVAVEDTGSGTYTIHAHYADGDTDDPVYRLHSSTASPSPYQHVRLEWGPTPTVRRLVIDTKGGGSGGPFGHYVNLGCTQLSETGSDPFPALGEDVTLVIEEITPVLPTGQMRIIETTFNGSPDAALAFHISKTPYDGIGAYDPVLFNGAEGVRIEWTSRTTGGGSATFGGLAEFTNEITEQAWGFLVLPTPTETTGGWPADGDDIVLIPLVPRAADELVPNGAARARVRFRAGQSGEQVFACDWTGAFQVHAQQIEIERVAYRPNTELPYRSSTVKLYAALSLDGDTARLGPQYTEPVAVVADGGGTREIPIPNFARRVSLLLKYGDAGSGDAPLAQLFVAFKLPHQGGMGFIDALSARAALFGDGIPIPHGAESIVLTNASGAPIDMGCLFHLGL